ncbi:antibiotic biosynthesis monooxygenase family protein [Bradyrhizobium sp. USDA 10063]
MFSVIFEVLPNRGNWDDYLDNAKMLRPELEQVEGFVDNIRYKSLTREGWILSLSNWRDEKSLVRWRTRMRHHEVQQKGRDEILADYHLRVGQITADNQIPAGHALNEQRLDETEVGEGTTVTLINATRPAEWKQTNTPYDCAAPLLAGAGRFRQGRAASRLVVRSRPNGACRMQRSRRLRGRPHDHDTHAGGRPLPANRSAA